MGVFRLNMYLSLVYACHKEHNSDKDPYAFTGIIIFSCLSQKRVLFLYFKNVV